MIIYRSQLMINRKKMIKRATHLMVNGKKMIKRAKILILEKSESGSFNIILFHNKRWNKYVTIGGRVERKESFANTIKREIIEETTNTLNIDKLINFNKLKYIDWYNYQEDEIEKVRIYFLILDLKLPKGKSIENIYLNNRNIIFESYYNISHDWKEMDNVTRIPIKNFYKVINTLDTHTNLSMYSDLEMEDKNGKKVMVYNSVINYVKNGLFAMDKTELISSKLTEYKITRDTSKSLLNGTEAIEVLF